MTLEPEEAARAALEAELEAINGFLQPVIFMDWYFEIETTAGTECVPSYLIGRTADTHVEGFLDYLEGEPLDDDASIECREGWVARLSAPGYMDCTPWTAHDSWEDAARYLIDAFGDD